MKAPNHRASRIVCPDDQPQLAAILAAWHIADSAADNTSDRAIRVEREARDRRLIDRARAGTLRHISQ